VIQSGVETSAKLAVAFINRGNAYLPQGLPQNLPQVFQHRIIVPASELEFLTRLPAGAG
jgi:hypothetical protein